MKEIKKQKKSILWLDIDPEDIPKDSSRNFLFRVTTPAHPWGYTKGDVEGRLGAGVIRDGLRKYKYKDPSKDDYARPSPEEIQPIEAHYPIPVSILINAFDGETINKKKLIDMVKEYKERPWAVDVLEVLENDFKNDFKWGKISNGIATALNTTILALKAPHKLLLDQTQQEENGTDITSIEHLFQRLNQQGTKLDGEELIYSLIKAYWPELSSHIDEISKNYMPCSRLISLAFRVIYTEVKNEGKMAKSLSVSAIRSLAKDSHQSDIQTAVREFIISDGPSSLATCCSLIDKWVGTKKDKLDFPLWGLPPVLRSSIAYNNQDLYLLLLLLAKNEKNASLDEDCCRLLTGIITYSAWFGDVKDQHAIAETLYSKLKDGISVEKLQDAVSAVENTFLPPLLSPNDLRDSIIAIPEILEISEAIPKNEEMIKWTWDVLIANSDESKKKTCQIF